MNIQVIILISNMTAFWNSIPQVMNLSDVKMGMHSSLWKSIHKQTKRWIIMFVNVKLPIILTFIHPATMLKWAHSGQTWVSCGALWQGIPTLIPCGPQVGVPTQSSQQFSVGKPTVGLATENQCRTHNSFALLLSWSPSPPELPTPRFVFLPVSLSSVYVCLSMVGTHCGFLPLAEHTCSYQPPAPPDHLIRRPLRWRVRLIFIDC